MDDEKFIKLNQNKNVSKWATWQHWFLWCVLHIFNCTISSFYLRTLTILNKGKEGNCWSMRSRSEIKKRGILFEKLILWNQAYKSETLVLCVERRHEINHVLSTLPMLLNMNKALKGSFTLTESERKSRIFLQRFLGLLISHPFSHWYWVVVKTKETFRFPVHFQ